MPIVPSSGKGKTIINNNLGSIINVNFMATDNTVTLRVNQVISLLYIY